MQSHAFTSPSQLEEYSAVPSTAVAIDRDKLSQQAVKWTVDNLANFSKKITLIHVRTRNGLPSGFSMVEQSPEAARAQIDQEMQQLFLPYKGFCARKGMKINEVVLEDSDVSKAIVDYISANHIQNIVVGNSNRNAITRKFKNPDVPSTLTKTAPDFCAVYVIYKGKPITVRSAKSVAPNTAMPPRQVVQEIPRQLLDQEERDRSARITNWRGQYAPSPQPERRSFERYSDAPRSSDASKRDRPGARSSPNNYFLDNLDSGHYSSFSDFNDSFEDTSSMGRRSMDFPELLEFSSSPIPGGASPPSGANRDVEAEMKRLRLELKQTMDMYSTACKEAITAKQKANELHQWKMEEARKFEELRSAEEAALAIAKMEKAKCKAALEAAEAAQRIAELEARKRVTAERRAKSEAEERKTALQTLGGNDVRYRKYSIEEIKVATDEFKESLKIGEGGYGPVFQARLDHTPVAIKVLRPDAAQGKQQFNQEIEVLSCIRHPNMVLLLGACPEYGCLVYEYMEYGSLDDRLFRRGNTPTIPWSIRFKIAAEIATALLFLHQTKPEPLVHRDLKPGNILLDRNYTSKISDVGLARLVPPTVADTVTQYRMTSTAGTFCYIDPEYQQTGMLGTKSDIYSLGIMLLQIITAKPPMGLSHHVERAIERGQFHEMLDQSVTDWPVEDALSFAKIALKCAQLRRKDRPDLATVVLPELNRLRNLGYSYQSVGYFGNSSNSGTSFGAYSASSNHSSFNNSQPRPQSHTMERSSNPYLHAPRMSASDM
ncbi:uncharacterized protein A4U43_C01F22960 [Asparagus officinalis]|uniref:RING-type E3 ubiquitin transferase n=1 Tax=Asparagus officinalis TaxID=4686 RepID=A0A5P1FTZ4_ASPOF|nr:U-box domain-containing protein 52-like [Asparagus officinalis]ONK80897.1 uncharacterized protein A4U43_C01F22960 [Asparagus officinalis]